MNKKFITLCVSALLAGGMVTPAFAAIGTTFAAERVDGPVSSLDALEIDQNQYYTIRFNNTGVAGPTDWFLKGTFEGYTASNLTVDGYSLWRITEHKGGNNVIDGYQITNAYGIPLAIKATTAGGTTTYSLDKDGDITVFHYADLGFNEWALCAWLADGTRLIIDVTGAADANNNLSVHPSSTVGTTQVGIYTMPSTGLSASQLNSVFDGYFGLQIGRPDKDGKFDGYEDEGLQGNVFSGKLFTVNDQALSSSVLTYRLDQSANVNETYLVNEAGEFIVLLKDKWNVVNTNLNGDVLRGYRFATMTAKELA